MYVQRSGLVTIGIASVTFFYVCYNFQPEEVKQHTTTEMVAIEPIEKDIVIESCADPEENDEER